MTMWLPVSNEAARPSVELSQAVLAPLNPLNILAIDDDETVLVNTAAMLSDFGHKVLQTSSGADALEVLRLNPIDLIVTDYAMPGMTGEQFADAALVARPGIPILIISGYAELPTGFSSRFPRLSKPFREGDLAKALSDVVGTAAHTN